MKTLRALFDRKAFHNPAQFRACRIEVALYCLAALVATVAVIIACQMLHWQTWAWVTGVVYVYGVLLAAGFMTKEEIKDRRRWEHAIGLEFGRIAWNMAAIPLSTAICALAFCLFWVAIQLLVAVAALCVPLGLATLLFYAIRWAARKLFCQPGAAKAAFW